MKKFSSKITVLVCMTMSKSFSREFPIAAVLSPSLKSCFISEFNRFSKIKKVATGK